MVDHVSFERLFYAARTVLYGIFVLPKATFLADARKKPA